LQTLPVSSWGLEFKAFTFRPKSRNASLRAPRLHSVTAALAIHPESLYPRGF